MTSMSARYVGTTSTRNNMAIEVYQIDDFLDVDLPEVPSLLGDNLIVPEGRVIIYGRPGTFKSFATLHLCYALAGNKEWLGHEVKENVPVLYLQAEVVPKMMQERAGKVRDTFGRNPDMHTAYIRDFTLRGQQAFQEVVDVANEVGAGFIFFDPMVNIMAGSELNDEAMKDFFKDLDRITVATGAGIGLVHHSRKETFNRDGSQNNAGAGDLRGHSSIEGWADLIIRLRRNLAMSGGLERHWEKVRYGTTPHDQWLRFDDKSGILKVSESDPRTLILELLKNGPQPIGVVDAMLVKSAGLGKRKAGDTRQALAQKNVVRHYQDPVNKTRRMIELQEGLLV